MEIAHKHSLDLEKFGFFTREKRNGRTVIYRCGRDFFYYALNFYYPNKFNPRNISAVELEKTGQIGWRLPWWLMWTLLQFSNTPKLLENEGLELYINNRRITGWFSIVFAFLTPYRSSYENILENIETSIENHEVIGVDLSLKYGGLLDHIMFVYGYDDQNVYVFDSHKVPILEYEKITDDDKYIMKIPKRVVEQRCGAFCRVWKIVKK